MFIVNFSGNSSGENWNQDVYEEEKHVVFFKGTCGPGYFFG